jgi:hypothetical protein
MLMFHHSTPRWITERWFNVLHVMYARTRSSNDERNSFQAWTMRKCQSRTGPVWMIEQLHAGDSVLRRQHRTRYHAWRAPELRTEFQEVHEGGEGDVVG